MKTVESKNRTEKRTEITTSSITVLLFLIVKANGCAEWRGRGRATYMHFVLCLARTCLPVRTHYGEFRRGLRPVHTRTGRSPNRWRARCHQLPPPCTNGWAQARPPYRRPHRSADCPRARHRQWAGGEGRAPGSAWKSYRAFWRS